eukprot:SAG31_NODE_1031_length_10234_cov_6.100049_3_plen_209_part_00
MYILTCGTRCSPIRTKFSTGTSTWYRPNQYSNGVAAKPTRSCVTHRDDALPARCCDPHDNVRRTSNRSAPTKFSTYASPVGTGDASIHWEFCQRSVSAAAAAAAAMAGEQGDLAEALRRQRQAAAVELRNQLQAQACETLAQLVVSVTVRSRFWLGRRRRVQASGHKVRGEDQIPGGTAGNQGRAGCQRDAAAANPVARRVSILASRG